MADEFGEAEALRGHINCGGVMLNLDKLTFSLSCIYCDIEMLSIKEFGYHFQDHLVMSKAENEMLLRNVEENVQRNFGIMNGVEQMPNVLKTQEIIEKQTDYDIEVIEDTTEGDNVEISANNEDVEQEHYVYQMMNNEIATEFNDTHELNDCEIQQIDEQEIVDIGFDLVPDEATVLVNEQQIDSFSCDICDFKFADSATLRKHRQHHHRCSSCRKNFPSKAHLNLHMRTHKYKSNHDCSECGQGFSTQNDLEIHKQTHLRKPLHLCSTCGKNFKDEQLLLEHIKVHARPFVCKECNMTFSKSRALLLHTKLHADVRKFNCSICRMTFAQSSGLINHLKDRHSDMTVDKV